MARIDPFDVLTSNEFVTDVWSLLPQVFAKGDRYLDVVVAFFARGRDSDTAFRLGAHPVALAMSMVKTVSKEQLVCALVTR